MATESHQPAPRPIPQHLPFLTLVLLLLIALHAFHGPVRSWFSGRYRAETQFRRALDICLDEYVDPRAPAELIHGAIEGMVEALKDRHSAFLTPTVHQRLREHEEGRYAGLGINIDLTRDERLVITRVFDDSPALAAGLRPGDIILWAAEHDPDGLKQPAKTDLTTVRDITRVSAVLRGKVGSKVTLGIRRKKTPADLAKAGLKESAGALKGNATEDLEITVVRAEIRPPLVEVKLLPDRIGYLRIINDFPDDATRKVRKGLEEVVAQGAKALVLDLRGNQGGFLDEAIRIADLFVRDGVIVSTKNRYESENRVFQASPGGPGEDLPMAVLVDAGSASAAEILAGTLQDHGRAKLVGTKTYGKGAVSKRFPLGDGSGILLSTGRYILPKGRTIEGIGLEPDLVVHYPSLDELRSLPPEAPRPDPQLDAAVKLLKDQLTTTK